jgi:1-acyl-sn-glycerol-3-phosphate acyltransferase
MFLRRLYSVWAIFSVAIYFLIFIIPLLICVPFRKMHWVALGINRIWSWGIFRLAFIPLKIDWRFKLDRKQQYILCANHFSYLDIPTLGLFPKAIKFVGKSQLGKIPLFGFMYNRIHIPVNRSSFRSRAKSLAKAQEELSHGFSLGFFPEGGIRMTNYPEMVPFKDGAFRLAVQNNVPIVPITFPDNYNILKDNALLDFHWQQCRVIYHEPIWPNGTSDECVKQLRDDVFRVIQSELNASASATV